MTDPNKLEEISFLLPVAGVFLFSPVLLAIFDDGNTLMGIPHLHIYLFSVWLGLLGVSFWLSRHLTDTSVSGDQKTEMDQADHPDQNMKL